MRALLVALMVGAIAGWLAGTITRGSGYGLIGDLIVGITGAVIGSWLWGVLSLPPIGPDMLGRIITATAGAVVLLLVLRRARR